MASGIREIFNYRRDKKTFLFLAVFLLLTVLVYLTFFDILIPNIQNDSYRSHVGSFFIVPVIILTLGQAGLGGIILHLFSRASAPGNADWLRAATISSIMTLWFSLTYFWFPKYGPFYYIVFVYGQAPWYALPLELGWTIGAILMGTLLSRKLLKMPYKACFLSSVMVYTVMTLGAS